MKTVKI